MGVRIVTTAVVSIHTPTITLVVVRPGKSGGHGGSHKYHHECRCHENFNDAFQTSSPPFPCLQVGQGPYLVRRRNSPRMSRSRHTSSVQGSGEVCIWPDRALFVVLSGDISYSPFGRCTGHIVPLRAFGTHPLWAADKGCLVRALSRTDATALLFSLTLC